LTLSLAQVCAVSVKHGIVSVRQSADKSVRIGKFCRCHHFFIGGIQFSETDIFRHGSGKQVGILENDPKGMSQIILADLSDIDSVVTDLSVLNIIETVDQVGDGRLSCSGGTDKSNLLTRF